MKSRNKKALCVLNGNLLKVNQNFFKQFDFFSAADGGAQFFKIHNIIPNFIAGDFDSLSPDTLDFFQDKTKIYKFPVDKDFSDCHLMFDLLKKNYSEISELTIIGVFSNVRVDHFLINLNIISHFSEFFNIEIVDEFFKGFFIINEMSIEVKKNTDISIISLSEKCTFEKSSGLKWPLNNIEIKKASSRGLSNRTTSSRIYLKIREGHSFVIIPRKF
ncbi:MAG: thiamine diphosphokinase [Candidatus Muiribacteriota bacterium]